MLVQADQYVNIHSHRKAENSLEWVLVNLMAEDYPPDPDAYYSVGLHPWNIRDEDVSMLLKRVQLATENCQVLALGETGLDKMIATPVDFQLKVFKAHIQLAQFADLPVIIHAVRSFQELIHLAKDSQPGIPMIIHGFRGSLQIAKDLIEAGYHLSFGQTLLKSKNDRETFRQLPLEKIFLETDESETDIIDIYKIAAEVKKISKDQLRTHLAEKVNNLFSRES